MYSHEELDAFEQLHGIVLPDSYRTYLLSVGAGTTRSRDGRPSTLDVSLLEDWCQPYLEPEPEARFLATAFDPDRPRGTESSEVSPSMEGWQGAMRVVNLGGESYVLLVVTGPLKGTLWTSSLQQRQPTPLALESQMPLRFEDVAGPFGRARLDAAVHRATRVDAF